jgi:hypothetical protein
LYLERQVAAAEDALAAESDLTSSYYALRCPVPRILAEAAGDAANRSPDDKWLPGRKQQYPKPALRRHHRYYVDLGLCHPELLAPELWLAELWLAELWLTELRLAELRLAERWLAERWLAELWLDLLEWNRSRADGG